MAKKRNNQGEWVNEEIDGDTTNQKALNTTDIIEFLIKKGVFTAQDLENDNAQGQQGQQ